MNCLNNGRCFSQGESSEMMLKSKWMGNGEVNKINHYIITENKIITFVFHVLLYILFFSYYLCSKLVFLHVTVM